ncbi:MULTISPECIES: tyrosine-protein phosphatase [Shewanella]|uniref:protein-tyrosine-phosphatase n=1 Tax=Shewanella polaris TaxID=2588449 RepID=A0A4Y5YGL2_9GAMM|nr:CpsB/CapC family capsule biosynthesis tyrosine phosphatase [Shewanella polaris]QDE31748.1 capsule biosynthesis protein CapC [Shewanella polaris]
MIDLHCHILPNLDDGAKSIDEAIGLVALAVEQGVSRMVATPHIHLGIFNNNLQSINKAYDVLCEALALTSLDVQIRTAAEVRITPEIMLFIEQQQLPFLGRYQQKDVLLLELPSSHIPPGTDKLISWLLERNVLPMIAHPERNRELQSHPERINPFVRSGCLFQLTAASLIGDMGPGPQKLSEFFIKQKLYSIMASDCHSLNRRPPKLMQASNIVTELTSQEYAYALTTLVPDNISNALFAECGD